MIHKISCNERSGRQFRLWGKIVVKTTGIKRRGFDLGSLIFILLVFMFIHSVNALEPLKPLRTDIPPTIDGYLNDTVWKDALSVTGFKTWMPDYGLDMFGKTEVYLAYDSENLYFAFCCYDHEPNKIKTSVTNRDNIINDDWVCINLDSFNDRQSLYTFYVNPLGIQMDARSTGDDEDYSIDMVWYSEGLIDEEGYTAEIRIPFKSIRFSNEEPVKMGVLFERNISRTSEMGTYPPLDPQQGSNFFTQTRTLLYRDIKHYNLFEILPAITSGRNSSLDRGKMLSAEDQTDASLTAKFGMTSDLVLDGTYNPDFSQVEADAGQVDFNIRYGLFYDEKRPFFIEGMEQFNIAGTSMSDPLRSAVHTRTITNPLVGAKLIGKAGEKNTFATIYALDELPENLQQGEYANVAILRYKRTLNSDGFIGGFGTIRELDNSYNHVIGTDGLIRINNSSRIGFHGFLSQDHAEVQSGKDNGHALGINYTYNTRDWVSNLRLRNLSKDFNTEVGYLTRTGITKVQSSITRLLYPKSKVILRFDPLLVNTFTYDKESGLWEHYNAFYFGFTLPRNTRLRLGPAYESEIFLGEEFNTSFLRGTLTGQFAKQVYFGFDYRFSKRIRYVDDPYLGQGHTAWASVVYQPTDKFSSNLDLTYSDFYRESNGEKEFDYTILRFKNTYQMNKYLFFRAVLEYNSFREELMTDFLASFTYIPGTVIHIGYGSLYDKTEWQNDQYVNSDRFLEVKRSLFFKASYLWRL